MPNSRPASRIAKSLPGVSISFGNIAPLFSRNLSDSIAIAVCSGALGKRDVWGASLSGTIAVLSPFVIPSTLLMCLQ